MALGWKKQSSWRSTSMRISHEAVTTVLGPGRRYAIWVQGCGKRCPGCINPAGWDMVGGYERSVEALLATIHCTADLDGITISGGEPFLQFNEVKRLVERLKATTDLDVMIYTGYTVEELRARLGNGFSTFLTTVDILVDGEYVDSENTGSMYRGSDNQRILFGTEKYRAYAERIARAKYRPLSFEIGSDGAIFLIGLPPPQFYGSFLQEIAGGTT